MSTEMIYSWKDIQTCAQIAKLSYDKNAASEKFKCLTFDGSFQNCLNLEGVYFNDVASGAEMFILDSPGHMVLGFCGTNGCNDWKHNLAIKQVEFPYVRTNGAFCHEGFFVQYEKLRPQIVKFVEEKKTKESDLKILCVGHSLAAALATLCGLDMDHLGYKCDVVTFGGPRCMDRKLCNVFMERIQNKLRVVNDDDIVPSLPSRWRYKHFEPTIRILDNGEIRTKERSLLENWRNVFISIFQCCHPCTSVESIEDHSMEAYLVEIDDIIKNLGTK